MCMGSAKATGVSNDQAAMAMSNSAMNNREQTYSDQIQKYYNPETVTIDPNKFLRQTVEFNQLRKAIDESGRGDENYGIREKVRNQINQNLDGIDPATQRELVRAGMEGAILAGSRPTGSKFDRGSVIASNLFGRGLVGYRQGVRNEAMQFVGANPSQSALPAGTEMAGVDIINRQNYADARNQKMKTLADLGMWSINNENNRNQQTMSTLAQSAANRANAANTIAGGNAASKGAAVGGGIAAVGTIAATAALLA